MSRATEDEAAERNEASRIRREKAVQQAEAHRCLHEAPEPAVKPEPDFEIPPNTQISF
jgi:hypothetical protein